MSVVKLLCCVVDRFANKGRLREAIADFEAALCINHAHRNAKKYLVETQIALGQR